MPIYDYRCEGCATEFEARRPVEQRDEVPCPQCGGRQVVRAMPLAVTYVKSPRAAMPADCCGGARDGSGCACCRT